MTIEPELGATVADARRLARKASTIFVHFPCGPDDWQTECIILGRAGFLRAVRYKDDSGRMPCKLYRSTPSDEMWLQIGGRGEQ
jgi:hypothetical protein